MTSASQLLHTFSNASSLASNLGPASPPGAWGALTAGGQRRGTQLGTLDERASSAAGGVVWESVGAGADPVAGIAAWLPRDVWTLSAGLCVGGVDGPGAAEDGVESSVAAVAAAVAAAGAGSSFTGLLHYGIAPRALQSLQPDDLWIAPWAAQGEDSEGEEGDAWVRVSASVGQGVGSVAGVSPFASAASAEAVVAAAGAGTRRGTRMGTGGGAAGAAGGKREGTGGGAGGAAGGARGGSGGGAGGGVGGRSPPMSTSNSMLSDQAPHTSLFKVWKCGNVGYPEAQIVCRLCQVRAGTGSEACCNAAGALRSLCNTFQHGLPCCCLCSWLTCP